MVEGVGLEFVILDTFHRWFGRRLVRASERSCVLEC